MYAFIQIYIFIIKHQINSIKNCYLFEKKHLDIPYKSNNIRNYAEYYVEQY